MKRKISIKTGINLLVILFSIVSLAITGIVVSKVALEKLVDTSIKKNSYIAQTISENLNLYLLNAMETVETAAVFSSESKGDRVSIQNEIFRIYDNFSYFDLIFFMDKEGVIEFSKPTNKPVTENNVYKYRDYYENVKLNKEKTASNLFMSTILNKPHIVLAAPVFNNDEWIGIIGCGIPINNIENIVKRTQINEDENIWVFDKSGSIIISPNEVIGSIKKLENKNITLLSGEKNDYRHLIDNKLEINVTRTENEVAYVSSTNVLDNFGWMVMVEQTAHSMQLEASSLNRPIMNTMFLILFAAVVFGVFFTSYITLPIQRLVKDTENIGEEDYHIINHDSAFKEVEELTLAFAKMGDRIDRKIKDVQSANDQIDNLRQRLSDIFENLSIGIIVCDNKGIINFTNKRTTEITAFEQDEIIGIDIREFYKKLSINTDSMITKTEEEIDLLGKVEIQIKNKNNQEVPVLINSSSFTTKTGQKDGMLVIIDDKTEIKFLEEEIMREDRIRMLGELSASIIHDIGNPIAGISNLVEVLKNGNVSEEDKDEIFNIIQTEVNDLNKMVRDFLDYTKSKGSGKDKVSLADLIKEIVFLFKIEARKRNIKLETEIDEKILLDVNRMEVKQALLNIINNSMHAVSKNGVISITAKRDNGKINLRISDDGMGIKEENIDKIFNPFFTTKDTGTGLGLPIAYKSITANGGYITVGSVENKGTNFIITFLE